MSKADLIGMRFGRLIVVGEAKSDKANNAMWLCRCDCGQEKVIRALSLKSGGTSSCGCRQGRYRHGMKNTRMYRIWSHMVGRCCCESDQAYPYYGGRGITVCAEWESSFEMFASWSLSHGYKPTLTLDRIDNDKGYEPGNCRWSTPKEQANNRSNNVVIECDGVAMTATQWAEKLGRHPKSVLDRIYRGWSPEEAVRIPHGKRRNYV